MPTKANYEVVGRDAAMLLIRDVGPWDQYLTITNAAESVVADLAASLEGRRLFYRDSEDTWWELRVRNGKFAGFAPAFFARREAPETYFAPVPSDRQIPRGARCQEASPFYSTHRYIPCGAPAVEVVYHAKDRRAYFMCAPCADHNVRHRGGKLVTGISEKEQHEQT